MRALPAALATAEPAVVRPRDLAGTWSQPSKELAALARQGAVLRLAHGYYAVVPEAARGRPWTPPVEAAGLAVGQLDYGRDAAVVMGPSAARLLGHLPRALAVATIAVPKQRPPLETAAGRIRFVTRDVEELDAQRVDTVLGFGLVTTVEQTLLDLVDRPVLGGLPPADLAEALRSLADVADLGVTMALADRQHKRRAHGLLDEARGGAPWDELVGRP